MNETDSPSAGSWESQLITRIAMEGLREQRRARRWGIFFKLSFLGYAVLLLLLYYFGSSWSGIDTVIGSARHTALVDVQGVIAMGEPASAENIIHGLEAAFENEDAIGVILRINSPGGSPVEAGYVYDRIQELREEYPDKGVYAVVTDVCASGGYYIAAAAEQIYVDKASIVGSIGVVFPGFGFVETLEKLGLERRLFSAGKHKGLLDPFSPLKDKEVEHLQGILENIHQQFIQVVREGRGERLDKDDEEIFSGLVWTGEQSIGLGLVDGLGSADYVANEVIQAEEIVDYTYYEEKFLQDFLSSAARTLGKGLMAGLGLEQTAGGAASLR